MNVILMDSRNYSGHCYVGGIQEQFLTIEWVQRDEAAVYDLEYALRMIRRIKSRLGISLDYDYSRSKN